MGPLPAHWNPSCLYPKRVANEAAVNLRAERREQGGDMSASMLLNTEVEETAEQNIVARRDRHHRGRMGQRAAPPKA